MFNHGSFVTQFSREIDFNNIFSRSDNAVKTYLHCKLADFLHGVALSDLMLLILVDK